MGNFLAKLQRPANLKTCPKIMARSANRRRQTDAARCQSQIVRQPVECIAYDLSTVRRRFKFPKLSGASSTIRQDVVLVLTPEIKEKQRPVHDF